MKYVVDITKPPILPPEPPCREMKGWVFPQETKESLEKSRQWKQDCKDWDLYIQEYKLARCKYLDEVFTKNKLKQENNIDFEI